MKRSTYSGHIPVSESKTVLIWEGVEYPDDDEAVVARPELFEDVKPPAKRGLTGRN